MDLSTNKVMSHYVLFEFERFAIELKINFFNNFDPTKTYKIIISEPFLSWPLGHVARARNLNIKVCYVMLV